MGVSLSAHAHGTLWRTPREMSRSIMPTFCLNVSNSVSEVVPADYIRPTMAPARCFSAGAIVVLVGLLYEKLGQQHYDLLATTYESSLCSCYFVHIMLHYSIILMYVVL